MNQTFYIDVDEEVTSVVDRLRSSTVKENILVVPQRALILQSIVNLKLLKKEAEKLKKQIMIVTQDRQGKTLAEKSNILVQSSMEGMEVDEVINKKSIKKPEINEQHIEKISSEANIDNSNKKRIDNLGSSEFFNKNEEKTKAEEISVEENSVEAPVVKKKPETKETSRLDLKTKFNEMSQKMSRKIEKPLLRSELDPKKEKELENLYRGKQEEGIIKNNTENEISQQSLKGNHSGNSGRKMWRLFLVFGVICVFAAAAVVSYLVFPEAKIDIYPVNKKESIDLDVEGSIEVKNVDFSNMEIPIRIIDKEAEVTFAYNSTGTSSISDQKARGTVVIYNEYSENPQPLVATTRLLTEDGKLFRLVDNVVVPGMSEVDGESKPGAVEVKVIADQSGSEFNIEPATFKIPGFEGGPKYEKFYAQSSNNMVGGGTSGEEVVAVSEEDIENAKEDAEEKALNELEDKIKSDLREGEIFVSELTKSEIIDSSSSYGEETMTETFDYSVKAKMQAFIFSEDKLKKLVKSVLIKDEDSPMEVAQLEIEYGQISADFEENSLEMKVHAEVLFQAKVNEGNFKKDVIGKNEEQLRSIVGEYEQIDKIEITFWPEFLSNRVPRFEKKVEVKVIDTSF